MCAPSAMDAALDAVAAIPPLHSPLRFKRRVRDLFKSAPRHPFVWTRFGRLAEAAHSLDRTHCLSAARLYVELERRKELRKRQASLALWGRYPHPRMGANLIDEARLVLRWMQRYAPGEYAGVRDAILYPELQSEAAE